MIVQSRHELEGFRANDGCWIQELLHPRTLGQKAGFSLAHAEVDVGQSTYRHRLEQVEAYYILAGEGCMYIADETRTVSEGDAVIIPAQAEQWIENAGTEPLRFIAVVCPPWTAEGDERLS